MPSSKELRKQQFRRWYANLPQDKKKGINDRVMARRRERIAELTPEDRETYLATHHANQTKYRRSDKYKTGFHVLRGEKFSEQEGKCAICQCEMTLESHKANSACLDHDHTTEEIRGLLCNRCNSAIGLLDEDPKHMQAAVLYLQKYSSVGKLV